jgi:hypothetical protein
MNFKTASVCNRVLGKASKLINRPLFPLAIQTALHNARLGIVQNYLRQQYAPLISAYQRLHEKSLETHTSTEKIIWVCWLQGLEGAPEIVKKCVDNIQRLHSDDCRIHVITLENYRNFVQLPRHIEEKFEKNLIKPAHFSDVLRLYLLAEHGGAWIDSTVLILKKLPDDVFNAPFFSLKSVAYPINSTISYGKWTTFFIKAEKGNVTALFLRDLLSQYWQTHDTELDYFLFDHAISIAYQSFPAFKRQIDAFGYFGNNRHLLMTLLFAEYTPEADIQIMQDPVQIYKLSYKVDPPVTAPKNSFYQHYIKPAPH